MFLAQQYGIWQLASHLPNNILSPVQRAWLLDSSSLTQRLRGITDHAVHFILLQEGWAPLLAEEKSVLMVDDQQAWVREIEWSWRDTTLVVARAVIPSQTLNANHLLQSLGSRSLGDVLFQDPSLQRNEIELANIDVSHPYFLLTKQRVRELPDTLWVRRSIFYFNQQPLLVVEVFLPKIFLLKG